MPNTPNAREPREPPEPRQPAARRARAPRLPTEVLEQLARYERAQALAGDSAGPAQERAEALLREYLTAAEWEQLSTQGYVEVPSKVALGRIYRIPRHGGRPLVYERGRLVCQLCVGPLEPLPRADLVLLHLVMIRGDEASYLASANRLPV